MTPPTWFTPERYSHLPQCAASDPYDPVVAQTWLDELQHCAALHRQPAEELQRAGPIDQREWDFLPAHALDGSPPRMRNAFIGPPPIELIEPGQIAPSSEDLGGLGRPLTMVLNLDAPDVVLRAAFTSFLIEARERRPSLAPRPRGPKALNSRFKMDTFERWRFHRIVELCELTWWTNTLPAAERPTRAKLAGWIFGCDNRFAILGADPNQIICEADDVLAAALVAIPALWAQTIGDGPELERLRAAKRSGENVTVDNGLSS